MLLLDRIYRACIRQCWYLHTVAYMYVNIHTLMQLGFMHTNVTGSILFQIRSCLSKTNNLSMWMLRVNTQSTWTCCWCWTGRICIRVQFVIVGQYTCRFSLLFLWLNAHLHFVCFCYISIRIKIQLHVMSRYTSISICCSCGSIAHLNSGVKVRYVSKRVNASAVCT